jgi:hypothetical protein
VRVYARKTTDLAALMAASRALPGVEAVLDGPAAARRFELPLDLEGDFVVLGDAGTVVAPPAPSTISRASPAIACARTAARRAEGALHGLAQAAPGLGLGQGGAGPAQLRHLRRRAQRRRHIRQVGLRMPRHRIALIGLGMAVTPHAKSLLDLEDRVEVAWAMSPSPARARRSRPASRFAPRTASAASCEDRCITAVAVLTPPNTHLEIAAELAKAGKHILLEKPLDISTARAEQLVAACRDAGVTLGVVLQHRFKPAAERLAAILRAGALGEIVNCSTSIRLWRPQSYYDEPAAARRHATAAGC